MNVDNGVFIQLQCSVDDGTFMAHMKCWLFFLTLHLDDQNGEEEEEEFVVDEHDEGLIEPPRGRTARYTMEEDKLLCQTWLQIGMDPVVGTDQKRNTYWMRMKEYFDAHNTSGNECTDRSLWS
jgi:hypothetical protein